MDDESGDRGARTGVSPNARQRGTPCQTGQIEMG